MARKREGNERGGNGRFAYEGLDRVLHEKARLGILTSLVAHPDGLRFGELRTLCALTDGNLSRHLDVLREAGLVEVWKGFEERRPQTLARLSTDGRRRFIAYLEEAKIETRLVFAGNVLKQPGFEDIPRRVHGELTGTDTIMNQTLFIGVYPGLTSEMREFVAERIAQFFKTQI